MDQNLLFTRQSFTDVSKNIKKDIFHKRHTLRFDTWSVAINCFIYGRWVPFWQISLSKRNDMLIPFDIYVYFCYGSCFPQWTVCAFRLLFTLNWRVWNLIGGYVKLPIGMIRLPRWMRVIGNIIKFS